MSTVEGERTAFGILMTLSFCHLLNDVLASLVPSLYPILKVSLGLTFTQIGLLTMSHQVTASLLQPVIGVYTDRRPWPYSLAVGMTFMLGGMILLALGSDFQSLLVAAALVGFGSAVFHPESSRIARLASGGCQTGSGPWRTIASASSATRWGWTT